MLLAGLTKQMRLKLREQTKVGPEADGSTPTTGLSLQKVAILCRGFNILLRRNTRKTKTKCNNAHNIQITVVITHLIVLTSLKKS
jgi:hypothetical protein